MGQASDDHSELYRAPRGTFQWQQTPPDESSGHIHGKQRSQRSPNTSRHSGNTEKAPIFDLKLPTSPSSRKKNRVSWVARVHAGPLRVPFRPITLASRAITFKGFLTTLTLPREEESNEPDLAPYLGRSKRADPFSRNCRCCLLSGPSTRSAQAESRDSHDHFPDSSPHATRLEPLVVRKGRGTHGHASRRDGRESLCPSRTHGSSFTPRYVDPYPSLPLTMIMICMHDGKSSGSRSKRPKGVGCVKGGRRPSSLQGGREVP
ncbi:hypothetical protein CRG98_012254 [Punica granatum]|uniref:Uncharacterized protein n=1 Tax=Punica granatum TaxID=22663 RepID=A0A2I0KFV2_PUNGR|nr:hypothetical protein CRG98_012254 [Punica granatum]